MSVRVQVRTPSSTAVLSQAGGYVDPATETRGSRFRISLLPAVDFGTAEHRTVTVPWQGVDGDRVESTGHGNRTQVYQVKVESLTGDDAGLTAGEAYLSAVIGVRAEIWWQAPSATEPTVFDVETSTLDWDVNDALELGVTGDGSQPVRVFELSFTCQPFGRRVNPTVVPAVSSGTAITTVTPTVTVVYNGSSIAGWSAYDAGMTPSDIGVRAAAGGGVENTKLSSGVATILRSSLTFTVAAKRFLRVRFSTTPTFMPGLVATVNGTFRSFITPFALIGDTAYYYVTATSTFVNAQWWFATKQSRLTIREIAHQDVMPYSTTARQTSMTVAIEGTARTAVSARVRHTGALGDLVLYARQEDGTGNQPAMRVHRNASTSTGVIVTDTSAINGSRADILPGQVEVYEPPLAQIPPSTYLALVRHQPTVTGFSFDLNVSTILGSATLGAWQSDYLWRDGFTAGQWTNTELGLLSLPSVRVPVGSTAAKARIRIKTTQKTGIDELWLFDIVRGRLIRIAAGTGTPTTGGVSNHVFIDAPSMSDPRQTIYLGTQSDRSDARHASAEVHQRQPLVAEPGFLTVFVACQQEYPAVEFEFHERGFLHPGTV